jgi:hypothetical protein
MCGRSEYGRVFLEEKRSMSKDFQRKTMVSDINTIHVEADNRVNVK